MARSKWLDAAFVAALALAALGSGLSSRSSGARQVELGALLAGPVAQTTGYVRRIERSGMTEAAVVSSRGRAPAVEYGYTPEGGAPMTGRQVVSSTARAPLNVNGPVTVWYVVDRPDVSEIERGGRASRGASALRQGRILQVIGVAMLVLAGGWALMGPRPA